MIQPTALARAPLETASGPEAGLVPFVGLTGLVLAGFLVLARVSQGVVDPEDAAPNESEGPTPGDVDRSTPDGPDSLAPSGPVRPAPDDPDSSDPDTLDSNESEDPVPDDAESVETMDAVVDPPESEPVDAGSDPGSGADPGSGFDPGPGPGQAASSVDVERDSEPQEGGGRVDQGARVSHHERRPAVARGDPGRISPGVLLVNVALTQGLFGVVLAGGAVYFGVPGPALGVAGDVLSTGLPAVALGVGLGLALWVGNELASAVADTAGAEYDEGLRRMLAPADRRGWVLLLGATLPIIAAVEEFLFRAAAVGAASAAFPVSPWALVALSSVAFALGHGAQGRVGIVVTGGLGLALAGAFVLTNSLLAVVVAHYLVNALEFALHEGLGLPDPVWE